MAGGKQAPPAVDKATAAAASRGIRRGAHTDDRLAAAQREIARLQVSCDLLTNHQCDRACVLLCMSSGQPAMVRALLSLTAVCTHVSALRS